MAQMKDHMIGFKTHYQLSLLAVGLWSYACFKNRESENPEIFCRLFLNNLPVDFNVLWRK
jgi:hypothetical protein